MQQQFHSSISYNLPTYSRVLCATIACALTMACTPASTALPVGAGAGNAVPASPGGAVPSAAPAVATVASVKLSFNGKDVVLDGTPHFFYNGTTAITIDTYTRNSPIYAKTQLSFQITTKGAGALDASTKGESLQVLGSSGSIEGKDYTSDTASNNFSSTCKNENGVITGTYTGGMLGMGSSSNGTVKADFVLPISSLELKK